MSIEVHSLTPQAGQLAIDVRLSGTVNVTAFSARQKVTTFVADEISTNMHGSEPRLVVGERICWRVPVILSMPPTRDRGEVGAIDVGAFSEKGSSPTVLGVFRFKTANAIGLLPVNKRSARLSENSRG